MHSQRPWNVITEASGTIWIGGHANQSSDDRYSEIAIVQTRGAASRDAADNARLIARAPDLLARLEQALHYLDHPEVRRFPFALPATIAPSIAAPRSKAQRQTAQRHPDATEPPMPAQQKIAEIDQRPRTARRSPATPPNNCGYEQSRRRDQRDRRRAAQQ